METKIIGNQKYYKVYQKPITHEGFEGYAKIIEKIHQINKTLYYCKVKFADGDGYCDYRSVELY